MKKRTFILVLLFFVIGLFFTRPIYGCEEGIAEACTCPDGTASIQTCKDYSLGACQCPETTTSTPEATGRTVPGRTVTGGTTEINNPLTGKHDEPNIPLFIQGIIGVALGLTGVLALTSFIYGGMLWLVSMGNSGLVEKGKKVMIWSIIGLLVVFGSYAILTQIFKILGY